EPAGVPRKRRSAGEVNGEIGPGGGKTAARAPLNISSPRANVAGHRGERSARFQHASGEENVAGGAERACGGDAHFPAGDRGETAVTIAAAQDSLSRAVGQAVDRGEVGADLKRAVAGLVEDT